MGGLSALAARGCGWADKGGQAAHGTPPLLFSRKTPDEPYFLASAFFGSRNGVLWILLVTAPLRMHCAHTRIVLCVPLAVVTLTFCRFGLNLRREIPVILVPTPPRCLALPLCETVLPMLGFFPHTWQV